MGLFLQDVLKGLGSVPKRLSSKYFYDEIGDKLFQQIMNCQEYYPTGCELEIFKERAPELATVVRNGLDDFDLIEMGAGDATKSSYLLKELVAQKTTFTYMPIDISSGMIQHLESVLPDRIDGLKIRGLNGDYFEMLGLAYALSSKRKVIMFLGGNIGNFETADAYDFCRKLRSYLQPGDLVLAGFDLKKHPSVIRAAYNDREGLTRAFNLNLLRRINRELNGNFIPEQFDHYPSYDPASGSCKSYLISLKDQVVCVSGKEILFKENEYIYMEISQKYSIEETDALATATGFNPFMHFQDKKKWFLDTIWLASDVHL